MITEYHLTTKFLLTVEFLGDFFFTLLKLSSTSNQTENSLWHPSSGRFSSHNNHVAHNLSTSVSTALSPPPDSKWRNATATEETRSRRRSIPRFPLEHAEQHTARFSVYSVHAHMVCMEGGSMSTQNESLWKQRHPRSLLYTSVHFFLSL